MMPLLKHHPLDLQEPRPVLFTRIHLEVGLRALQVGLQAIRRAFLQRSLEPCFGNSRVRFPAGKRHRGQGRVGQKPVRHMAQPVGFQVGVQRRPVKMVPLRGYIYDFIEQTVKRRVRCADPRQRLHMVFHKPWMIEHGQHKQLVRPAGRRAHRAGKR